MEKPSSRKTLLGHEQQFEDIDDKEIHSAFPSRMKRKSILSITTDGSLKVRKRTIVFTNQHLGETKEDPEEASASYHITVEDNLCHDEMDDDVQEAPPQLEDGVQSTVDELKEINLGTLENPRPTFVSTLLTTQEERDYFKLLVEYKDVFVWSYKEMPGLSPKVAIHHLGIKRGTSCKAVTTSVSP